MITRYVEDLMIPVFKFLAGVGFLFLVGAIINIVIDKKKGLANQKILKKRDISKSDVETLIVSLNELKGYKKIFNYDKYLIVITEYDINVILVCDYYGILTGKEHDNMWDLKNGELNSKLVNPLIDFYKYIEEIKSKIGEYKINKYILLGGNSLLKISIKDLKVIRRNNIFYTLSTKKNSKIYTTQEIDKMYEKINM